MRAWREVADPSLALEGFEGQDCHLGLDLASRTDLAALALVFPDRDLSRDHVLAGILWLVKRHGLAGLALPKLHQSFVNRDANQPSVKLRFTVE